MDLMLWVAIGVITSDCVAWKFGLTACGGRSFLARIRTSIYMALAL